MAGRLPTLDLPQRSKIEDVDNAPIDAMPSAWGVGCPFFCKLHDASIIGFDRSLSARRFSAQALDKEFPVSA